MITFKDFPPRVIEAPGLLKRGVFGDVRDTVRSVDAWLKDKGIRPLTIETVVLPEMELPAGSSASRFDTTKDVTWFQVIRVWYETK